MAEDGSRVHVSLVAVPDTMASTLSGLYDVLTSFDMLSTVDSAVPRETPFRVEIVAPTDAPVSTASGLPLGAQRPIADIDRTDIVLVPSVMVERGEWRPGRYPEVVRWLSAMHARGATLCSACSGVLLLAETGLLDGKEATMHWAYAQTFRRNFPAVRLRLESVLVVTGERDQFVMSGASTSWHDLVLYLVARHAGPTAAQAIARFFALQWHTDGLAPYVVFEAPTDHGDAVVRRAQDWLGGHLSVVNPVEEVARRSGIPRRSFERRFRRATGYAPIAYVQRLRVEEAKRRLERTDAPIDEIGWSVGYEDPAFFRRLFKRVTGVTPGAYRRKFRLPPFARPDGRTGTGPEPMSAAAPAYAP